MQVNLSMLGFEKNFSTPFLQFMVYKKCLDPLIIGERPKKILTHPLSCTLVARSRGAQGSLENANERHLHILPYKTKYWETCPRS